MISVFLLVAGLVVLISAVVNIPSVQHRLVEQATSALSESTGLVASIDDVYVNWWARALEIRGVELSHESSSPLAIKVLGLSGARRKNGAWGAGEIGIEGVTLQLDSLLNWTEHIGPRTNTGKASWSIDKLNLRDISIEYGGALFPISSGTIEQLSGDLTQIFDRLALIIPSAELSDPAVLDIRRDTIHAGRYTLNLEVGEASHAAAHFHWDGTQIDNWALTTAKLNPADLLLTRDFLDGLAGSAPMLISLKANSTTSAMDAAFTLETEDARLEGHTEGGLVYINSFSAVSPLIEQLGKVYAPELLEGFVRYRPRQWQRPQVKGALVFKRGSENGLALVSAEIEVGSSSTKKPSRTSQPQLTARWLPDTISWEAQGLDWKAGQPTAILDGLRIEGWTGQAVAIEGQWEAFWDLETSVGNHRGGLALSLLTENRWEVDVFGKATALHLPHSISGSASVWAKINSNSDVEAVLSQGRLSMPTGEQHQIAFVHLQGNFTEGQSKLEAISDIGLLHLDERRTALRLELDEPKALAALIHPALKLGPGLRFETSVHKGSTSISAVLPGLGWNEWTLDNVRIDGESGQNSVRLQASVDSAAFFGTPFAEDLTLQLLPKSANAGNADEKMMTGIDLRWDGLTRGHIRGQHQSEQRPSDQPLTSSLSHALTINRLDLGIDQENWALYKNDTVRFRSMEDPVNPGNAALEIQGLTLSGDMGTFSVAGRLGAAMDDVLRAQWSGLPVEAWGALLTRIASHENQELAPRTARIIGKLRGEVSGEIKAYGLLKPAEVSSPLRLDFKWDGAAYDGGSLGHLEVLAFLDAEQRLRGTLSSFDESAVGARAPLEQLRLTCDLQAGKPASSLASVQMWNWPLKTITPWIAPADVQFDGTLSGEVRIVDPLEYPAPDGAFQIDKLQVSVTQSGTHYGVEGDVILTGDMIALDHALITDARGNHGRANLSVFHEKWRNFSYDVSVDIEEQPFLCLDLPQGVNEFFYGTVLATGMLDVSGSLAGVQIEGEAASHEGTVFSMPLDEFGDPTLPDHFHFIDRNTARKPADKPFQLDLTLDVEALKGTEVEVIFDSNQGDFMAGSCTGHLAIEMSRTEEFAMRGAIELEEGNYGFSFRDLVHKDIELIPGGMMIWSGDPYSAELGLETEYRIDASLVPLLGPGADHGRMPVQVRMQVAGPMNRPDLSFSLHFPRASAAVRAEAEAVLSREGETTRQAFALMVAGQFISPEINEFNAQDALIGNASELLSSQISSMLSQLSEEIDIGLRYTPSEENTTGREEDELAVAMATRLLDDRLRIKGSLGTRGVLGTQSATDNPNQTGNFLGSVEIEYRLTDDGRWVIDAYSAPSGADLFQAGQRHGIGISHRVVADRFRDLFKRDE